MHHAVLARERETDRPVGNDLHQPDPIRLADGHTQRVGNEAAVDPCRLRAPGPALPRMMIRS